MCDLELMDLEQEEQRFIIMFFFLKFIFGRFWSDLKGVNMKVEGFLVKKGIKKRMDNSQIWICGGESV